MPRTQNNPHTDSFGTPRVSYTCEVIRARQGEDMERFDGVKSPLAGQNCELKIRIKTQFFN